MGFMKEFKEFAMRGNVVDMAVGVVIGGAFGAVVTTLVDNVMLPIIGAITGKLGDLTLLQQSVTVPGFDPILIKYGMFLAAAVKFTITAFCLFLVVKAMNSMKRYTRVSVRFSSIFLRRSSSGTCANCSLIAFAVRS